jgi:hypothetical protein
LKESKRLKTVEDKQTLKNFKADIFNEDIPVAQTIDKYFKMTDKMETEHNVPYTNSACKYVAESVRKSMGKTTEYEVGEYLICKKYIKTHDYTCNDNFEFKIQYISEGAIKLFDPATQECFWLALQLIRSHFIHAYCFTCHSLQGSSIDKTISIFESDHKYVTRKWLYTAVTRATELKNVFFCSQKIPEENDSALVKYFNKTIKGYMQQDTNRLITETYVNVTWLMTCLNQKCDRCGCRLDYHEDAAGKITSNITAQRIDNSRPHVLNNIIPMCRYCNCSLK